MDPAADNFNEEANQDDGICEYPGNMGDGYFDDGTCEQHSNTNREKCNRDTGLNGNDCIWYGNPLSNTDGLCIEFVDMDNGYCESDGFPSFDYDCYCLCSNGVSANDLGNCGGTWDANEYCQGLCRSFCDLQNPNKIDPGTGRTGGGTGRRAAGGLIKTSRNRTDTKCPIGYSMISGVCVEKGI
jgi:hypothetical protein